MTKISDLTALTGAGVDEAADLFPIVDMSAAGAARNKKITVAEAKIALDVPTAITELDDVPDVNAPTPSNGDVLTWDSTPGEWVPTAPTTGATTLDGLTDVNAPTPGNGEVLTWDSTPGEWISQALPGAGAFVLGDATDVDTTGAASGNVLTYDGAQWEPAAPSGSFRGALVYLSASVTAQNYTSGFTAVAWDSEDYDTDAIHSTVTNTSRLTVPAGVSRVRLMGQVQVNNVIADDVNQVAITKNGSDNYVGSPMQTTEAGSTTMRNNVSSPVLSVTPGDYFELAVNIQSDTSVDISNARSWFAMEIIS